MAARSGGGVKREGLHLPPPTMGRASDEARGGGVCSDEDGVEAIVAALKAARFMEVEVKRYAQGLAAQGAAMVKDVASLEFAEMAALSDEEGNKLVLRMHEKRLFDAFQVAAMSMGYIDGGAVDEEICEGATEGRKEKLVALAEVMPQVPAAAVLRSRGSEAVAEYVVDVLGALRGRGYSRTTAKPAEGVARVRANPTPECVLRP